MSSVTASKLTKKQRKGLAFREKIGKGKKAARPEPQDVPESEYLDDQPDVHGHAASGLDPSTKPNLAENRKEKQLERGVNQRGAET